MHPLPTGLSKHILTQFLPLDHDEFGDAKIPYSHSRGVQKQVS